MSEIDDAIDVYEDEGVGDAEAARAELAALRAELKESRAAEYPGYKREKQVRIAAETELAALRAERDALKRAVEEARDLARTGLYPDGVYSDPETWKQHKLDRIAYILAAALKDTE